MKNILKYLKRIWILNFLRRVYFASKYYNDRYLQIIKWGFKSKEDTNFTYSLSDDNLIYLAQTISLVTKVDFKIILEYIKEAESNNELIEHILSTREKSDESIFSDQKVLFGRRLGWYAFVRALKPKVVIETGVDKGLGSVLLCSALEKNSLEGFTGKFYGTDINPKAGYLLGGRYGAFGEIIYGDSIESLKKLKGKIDLFINDSDHSADYEYDEYNVISDQLNEKAIILGDNSHVTNKLSQFSLENKRQFLFFQEKPLNHWYPGAGIGISFK